MFLLSHFLFFQLQAKQVGEFVKNAHLKISPTQIGSGIVVTLSLCDTVTLWTINRLISLPPCIRLGLIFLHILQKNMFQFFSLGKGRLGRAQGKKTLICQVIPAI